VGVSLCWFKSSPQQYIISSIQAIRYPMEGGVCHLLNKMIKCAFFVPCFHRGSFDEEGISPEKAGKHLVLQTQIRENFPL